MSTKLIFSLSIVFVLSLASTTYGIVIGDFENYMDGWALWVGPPAPPPGVTTSFSTTGASLNNYSLKLQVPIGGRQTVVYIPLHTEGLVGDFLANTIVSMDVTYFPLDWTGTGSWANFELVVNSEQGGWVELGRPDTDTVNPGYPAGWDPTNYPTIQTRTVTWDYNDIVGDISADTGWLELVFVTNYDELFTNGVYYLDNVQLTIPSETGSRQDIFVIGNWEEDLDGWEECSLSPPGHPVLTYSTTGATLDDYCLRMDIEPRWKWALFFKLQTQINSEELFDAFFSHEILMIDVTRLASDWEGPEDGFTQIAMVVNSVTGAGKVWDDYGGAGSWSPSDGDNTQTVSWDYSTSLPNLDRNSISYLEFVFWTNCDADFTNSIYYLDNARLFSHITTFAPNPEDEATDVQIEPSLSWKPGKYVDTHNVYFGTNFNDVNNANLEQHPNVTVATVDVNNYNPRTLELDTTYYWRVDEANDANTWKGTVWSFTTGKYLIVDDMESYGEAETPGPPPPAGSKIWYTWKDGEGWKQPSHVEGNGTGSVIDPEDETVHGGNQSLRFSYDNDGTNSLNHSGKEYYSEIRADTSHLAIGRDWTKVGVKALTLWFYGDTNNDANATEQMYVKLNGVRKDYDEDMNNIRQASWHVWNIDLAAFGIDLTNVTEIAIGFGDENNTTTPAGSGVVYFDDIRLYQPRCILSKRTADFATSDFAPAGYPAGDCVIDCKETEMIARDWLIGDNIIEPTTDPAPADGLVAYYPLDEGEADTVEDASGNYRNGTLRGGVTWVTPGLMGNSAINVDTTEGAMVDIGTWNPSAETGELTLAIWARWYGPAEHGLSQGLIGKRDEWEDDSLMFMFEMNTDGANEQLALRQYVDANTDVYSDVGTMASFIGSWTHAAVTFDGTTARISLNGVEIASGPFTFGSGTDASMALGNTNGVNGWGGSGESPEVFNGDLDEARIYNRALSPAEIAYLADATPDDGQLYVPVPPLVELYDAEPVGSRKIDLKDFATLANYWLEEQLWPY